MLLLFTRLPNAKYHCRIHFRDLLGRVFNFKLNSFVVEQVLQFHARTTISSVKTVCAINLSIFNMMSVAWIEYFWECISTHIP